MSPTYTIDSITLHRIDVAIPRHFSFGTWWNRQHVLLQLSSDGQSGWSEFLASANQPELDLARIVPQVAWLRGLDVNGAMHRLIAGEPGIGAGWIETAELALLDLIGNIEGVSALCLLGLNCREPVAGMPSVLSDDPASVAAGARSALANDLGTHLKVKLFGKIETDLAVIGAARSVIGPSAYLNGDANGGYGSPQTPEEIRAVASALLQLRSAGLSAAEDPAKMDTPRWVALQDAVGDFPLIADEPTRPAAGAADRLDWRMARIYNLHPACLGSIAHAVRLGHIIRDHGKQLMIGDNSLVGPGCTQWQQLAIGLGAAWVEALEKPEEFDAGRFLHGKPTVQLADGRFALRQEPRGFGVRIDETALRDVSVATVTI